MATVNPDDLFAVNRNDITYSVEQQNLMASLENTDYLAVNRDDVTYKITGQEFIESVLDPLELNPVVTAADDSNNVWTATCVPNVFGGKQPYTITYQWNYLDINGDKQDLVGETNATYTVDPALYAFNIGCFVTVDDSIGFSAEEQSNYIKVAVQVEIESVTLTENNDGGERPIATDEITSVTKTLPITYSDSLRFSGSTITDYDSASPGMNSSYPATNAFDGNESTTALYLGSGTRLYLKIPGLSASDKLEVMGGYYQKDDILVNGTIETIAEAVENSPPAYFTVPHNGGDVWVAITGSATNSSRYAAVKVNGRILIDNEESTKLAFSGDKDLVFLKAGDPVKQDNSPATPTTSEITNVVTSPQFSLNLESEDGAWTGTQTADKAFDNSDFTDQINTARPLGVGKGTIYTVNNVIDDLSIFSAVTEIKWWVYQNSAEQPATFTVNGLPVTPTLTASSTVPGGIYEWTLTRTASAVTGFTTGPYSTSVSHMLAGVFINGNRLVDGATILTLTDDTDLNLLEVGDEVHQDKVYPPSVVTYSSSAKYNINGTIGTDSFFEGGFLNNVAYTYEDTYTETFTVTTAGTLTLNLNCSNSGVVRDGVVSGDATPSTATPTISGQAAQSLTLTFASAGTATIVWTYAVGSNPGGVTYYFGYSSRQTTFPDNATNVTDLGLEIPSGIVSSITGLDMILSSVTGTWSANTGNYAIGPEKTITGTVGSVDATGRTVTLSEASGSWSANTGNYLLGPDISFSDDERFTAQSFNVDIKSSNISTEPITYSAKALVNAELLKAPRTSVITDVGTGPVAPPEFYEIRTENALLGVGGAAPLPVDYSSTTLQIEKQPFGVAPTPDTVTFKSLYVKLQVASVPTFVRFTGALAGFGNALYYSDDGVNWTLDGEWADLYGPGDTRASGTSAHVYWCWGFTTSLSAGLNNYGIDGVNSTIQAPVLTLTDDTDLTEFPAGQTVTQSGGNTPVSSAITNVAATAFSKVRAYYSSLRPNNLAEVLQGTEYDLTLKNTNVVEHNNWLSLVCDDGCPTSGPIFKTDGGPIFNMKYSSGGGNFTEDGTQLDTGANPPSGPSNTLDILFSDGGTTGSIVNTQAAYTILFTMNLGTTPEVTSSAQGDNTILTLTDDTNLANFRVGDMVQQEQANPAPYTLTLSGTHYIYGDTTAESGSFTGQVAYDTWSSFNYFNGNLIDPAKQGPQNAGNCGLYTSNNVFTYSGAQVGTPIGMVLGNASNNSVADINIPVSGDVSETSITIQNGNLKDTLPKFYTTLTTTATSGTFTLGNGTSYFVYFAGDVYETGGVVSSVDASTNQMTLSEAYGTWTAGTSANGPSFTATGTVGSVDVAAKTMTFSESDGRWLVTHDDYQEDLKLNTIVASDDQVLADATLYTILDAEGNVSDLTETDPGYKQMVTTSTIREDFDIKFPAVLGSGETPDAALPEGAQLCVDIFASNSGGIDEMLHGESGACLTPVDTGAPEGKANGVLYTGNGTSQDISCGFPPDLVWIKQRTANGVTQHVLMDSVRGNNVMVCSNATTTQTSFGEPPIYGYVSNFGTDGFTVTGGSHDATQVNGSGSDYVAWCWDAGDTTVTNNEGTIESTVRSSGEFSIISYSGNGSSGADATVGHGLDSAPAFVIIKSLTNGNEWTIYHQSLGNDYHIEFNLAGQNGPSQQNWNNTTPSSSVITLGTGVAVNRASADFIAYAWADSPTQSFGEYTGNGLVEGPVIDCGFEPAFVMIKKTSNNSNWFMIDSARGADKTLYANQDRDEANSSFTSIEFTSSGFKIINSSTDINDGDFIYVAFAGTTTRFDADDAGDVAAFNTVKAKLDAYPTNRKNFRRSLLQSVVTSGLSAHQKVYLLTEGADGETLESGPFALSGYFPLYDTEEVSDSVSTNGESHSHTIDGVTYYMPDSGVTLYHGNY